MRPVRTFSEIEQNIKERKKKHDANIIYINEY